MLGIIKASNTALSEEVILGVDAVKLVYCIRLERCRSTARVAAKVAAGVLPKGRWMLICMLRHVLDGGLLLGCIATLGYYIKLLGNWILGAVKASILYTARALP